MNEWAEGLIDAETMMDRIDALHAPNAATTHLAESPVFKRRVFYAGQHHAGAVRPAGSRAKVVQTFTRV